MVKRPRKDPKRMMTNLSTKNAVKLIGKYDEQMLKTNINSKYPI